MSFDVELKGADVLDRKLRDLEPKISKKHMARALREGAKFTLLAVKARAPEGKTGALKRSLKLRAGKLKRTKREQSVHVVMSTKKSPELVKYSKDGTRHFYPAVLEYGTRHRAAKPFFRPAWDASKTVALNTTMAALRKAVYQEATK